MFGSGNKLSSVTYDPDRDAVRSFQGHYRIWRLACMSGRFLQVMKHFVPEGYYCAAKDADKKKLLFLFKGLSVDFVQSDKQEKRRRVCINAAPTADHILGNYLTS
ncbi:hypothetical protein JHU04_003075 [Brenneria sp. 4F2]|nr:hypothetical protein [Brenneria bubanii]